jgi:hypothetical protein
VSLWRTELPRHDRRAEEGPAKTLGNQQQLFSFMTTPASLHALLTGAIDYAGLFPPAKLSIRDAAARYACYRGTAEAWALGRFVVPITQIDALAAAQTEVGAAGQGWRLSVLLGEDTAADAARIRAFNAAHPRSAIIDSAEMKVGDSASDAHRAVATTMESIPPTVRLFVEVPTAIEDLPSFIAVVARANACAKVRTGGVTADAIPAVSQLARFLLCCAEHDTRFKATAGLHHPWRGSYALTYEPQSPTAPMFGFLNVLVAAALARSGASDDDVSAVLAAEKGSGFRFTDDEIRWRDTRI